MCIDFSNGIIYIINAVVNTAFQVIFILIFGLSISSHFL